VFFSIEDYSSQTNFVDGILKKKTIISGWDSSQH